MVPFYGQGMNAGFEDVQVLYELLRTHSTENGSKTRTCDEERASALQQYTAQRTMDGHTINDLALNNYIEMRSSVRSTLYRSRKWVEEHVDYWFPQLGWSTQYSRVSFSNQRYSDVEKAVRKQGRVLGGLFGLLSLGALALCFELVIRTWRRGGVPSFWPRRVLSTLFGW